MFTDAFALQKNVWSDTFFVIAGGLAVWGAILLSLTVL